MPLLPSAIILFLISFILAVHSSSKELTTPKELVNLKIKKKEGVGGVILFLKSKIVHYSNSSSET
ncbi:hypothetical protein A3D77_02645 [Candidatus Gottesmanbacteria bacterium RIFCSPHIGHO2_02_FULL_39_11]|uniref:Uncharacterized protein n=1 Tax=Candidatus Gottesmanbacteria bacterium RIFCSPHIGHO2_02_FULL_39_11 TaxID=1798382 RepID=A0A1F5ZT29_9BACT|nr:MAG: hypothetical protein A3D77_02645 [Candidatus Gottesmanbacteria bacterium RIFCSPHIGHO2_02_FULL_39_11]